MIPDNDADGNAVAETCIWRWVDQTPEQPVLRTAKMVACVYRAHRFEPHSHSLSMPLSPGTSRDELLAIRDAVEEMLGKNTFVCCQDSACTREIPMITVAR
ncbi:MAG: hypothetical protein WAV48_06720 [Candidatus Magasanikiibacteriota bacterium]